MKRNLFRTSAIAVLLMVLFYGNALSLKSQTIEIDSLFTADGEIYPFEPGDTIYGLSISGTVHLFSDTSLVRVILSDIYGNEWMVYEAYPLIVEDTVFEIEEECDETCYLNESFPYSISIQIISASIDISYLSSSDRIYENVWILQQQAKLNKDLGKVQRINQYITSKDWEWNADTTTLVNMFYFEKTQMFESKYNLLGIDYYSGGIFNSAEFDCIEPYTENTITSSFDWRKKHDADILGTHYYGGESKEPDNGWMTGIRQQFPCNACGAFASVATLEAAINLYANYQFDINYNERFSERDAYNCSWWYGTGEYYTVGCSDDCQSGKQIFAVMDKFRDEGVVDSNCYRYQPPYCEGRGSTCAEFAINKCNNPSMVASICNYVEYDLATASSQTGRAAMLKELLINNGPLAITLKNWPERGDKHAVTLIGFDLDQNGEIVWIFKNSWGLDQGVKGYNTQRFWLGQYMAPYLDCNDPAIMNSVYALDYTCPNPLTIIADPTIYPGFTYEVQDEDFDKDGYYNWGIGAKPQQYECSQLEDWNDNNKRIGPKDENYNGIPVKPEMEVKYVGNDELITNHGFCFFETITNPTTLTFRIINPGSAKLHLVPAIPGTITITGPDYGVFDLVASPESEICMGHETDFSIEFNPQNLGTTRICYVHIGLQAIDKDVLEDFEFALVYNGCELEGEDQYVDEYTTVSDYEIVPNDIYIERNGTLEVTGSLAMYPGSDIYVEPGGLLKINGGLITGSCSRLWHGIDVLGDPRLTQSTTYQGKVEIIHGGCIEYAETAIETAYHPEPRRWYPSGGIIQCDTALFKDNITDVYFFPYTNRHPVTNQVMPNFSGFNHSTFETTDDFYLLSSEDPVSHLYLDDVEGISFWGCVFGNYSSQTQRDRGKGIESNAAGYYVKPVCRQYVYPCDIPCRFEYLEYGIRALNSNNLFTIIVDKAVFNYNKRGIHFRLVTNPTVIRSEFNVSDPKQYWTGDTLAGLYLEAYTKGFGVEENTFSGSSILELAVGIQTLNTGVEQNEIYNNAFNDLRIGISAAGENRDANKGPGLCLKCNDFVECSVDIYVTYTEDGNGNHIITANTGIAQEQGKANEAEEPYYDDLAAGNTFSDVTSCNYFNAQGCGPIEYIFHGNYEPGKKIIPEPFSGISPPTPDPVAHYTKQESCPSHLGGSITLSMEKNLLTSETALISDYNDTLLLTIDGGNTEGLNYEVITSFPEEALVIRQNLINESPYLSDTVMVSAIEKDEVLPGAMIRDILVQNPQAPKSNKILDALDNRQDTIPGYMMEEIMQGLNTYGAKEILEQKLGDHIAKRDRAWKNINLYFKNDTVNFGSSIDSLISIYQDENRLSTRYELAFMYLDQDDSASVDDILNSIPAEFDLTAKELSIHNHYQDLFNILRNVKSDTTGLDSLHVQALFDIFTEDKDIPGCYASNLLIKERSIFYHEPVYIFDELKSVPARDKKPETELKRECLKLFPNPAGNYFIAQYDLIGQTPPGILRICDIKGKELRAIRLRDKENQIVIPTQEYSNGVYLIRLSCGNYLIDSQKLTITR